MYVGVCPCAPYGLCGHAPAQHHRGKLAAARPAHHAGPQGTAEEAAPAGHGEPATSQPGREYRNFRAWLTVINLDIFFNLPALQSRPPAVPFARPRLSPGHSEQAGPGLEPGKAKHP